MERSRIQKARSLIGEDRGIALPMTLLIMAALLALGSAGLMSGRMDLMLSQNVVRSTKALWIAGAGSEMGKNWLEANLGMAPLSVSMGPSAFADGEYTVTVDRYTPNVSNGRYRIVSIGVGPDNSRKVVEEVVRIPNPLALQAVINIDGDGTHPDFDDGSGGTGRRIPDFSVDGRDHNLTGTSLSNTCPNVSPFAGTEGNVPTDITEAADDLKCDIVKRANAFCNEDGSGSGCTPGLYWVRGSDPTPRYTDDHNCDVANPDCCRNLDLSAPELRATAVLDQSVNPPLVAIPPAPDNRGPFFPKDANNPLVKLMNAAEVDQLRQVINEIQTYADMVAAKHKIALTGDLDGSDYTENYDPSTQTYTLGSLSDPKIVEVQEQLDVKNGVVVNGVGILVVPEKLRIRDATFNWTGIVLVLEDGDLRVDKGDACGSINGAVILQDDQGNDPKLDVDKVGSEAPLPPRCLPPLNPTGPSTADPPFDASPFSFNYSCGAIERALVRTLKTVSWTEQFGK